MLVYRLLAVVARIALGIFFRRIETEGAERLRADGPRIFVANHPNTLIDVLLVGVYYPGKIHFLAKSVLFKNPVLARFLRFFGVIPVYRQQDASDPTQNVDSFVRAYEVLDRGGAICLFPEGTSRTEPRLLKFKTGAARIAFGAEERRGFGLGVEIVPVALGYGEKSVFRSRALLRVAEPVRVAGWKDAYGADPQQAVRDLTAELERVFALLLPQADDWDELRSIDRVRRLYQDEVRRRGDADPDLAAGGLLASTRISHRFLEGYAYYKEADGDRIEQLRHKVDRFYEMLDLAGVPPSALALEVTTARATAYVIGNGVVLLAGLPFWLFGLVHNYPVYRAIGWITSALKPEFEYASTYKLLLGLVLVPLVHVAEAAVYGALLGPVAIPISLVATSATGVFTLFYWTRLRRFALGISVFFRNRGRVRQALEKRRRQILDEVEALVEAYPR